MTAWRKACAGDGACVEVGTWVHTVGLVNKPVAWGVFVRDSTDPDGGVLSFTPDAWTGLLTRIKEGR